MTWTLLLPSTAFAGLTIYAHGNTDGSVVTGGIPADIANAIAQRTGDPAGTSIYEIDVRNPDGPAPLQVTSLSLVSGPAAWSPGHNGETVIRLDWGPASGASHSTGQVAQVLADYLLGQSINGHSWLEGPLHTIGHSRGGALVAELAEDLGTHGVWVDHVTNLDPHPVDGMRAFFADWGDTFPQRWENIRFYDNYWRTQPGNRRDFTGDDVPGAYNLQLSESVLSTGGFNGCEHCDVPPWYYGTINTAPNAFVGFFTVPGNWYSGNMGPRDETGFAFSRLGGLARPADGIGQNFGGSANAVPLELDTANAFPNVATKANSTVELSVGESGTFELWVQDEDSVPTLEVWLDDDKNPANGNLGISVFSTTLTPQSSPMESTFEWTPQQIGEFYLYAEIADELHSRYDYWPNAITVSGLASDFNSDGQVNSADLALWSAGYGTLTEVNLLDGDADLDGDVDGHDFLKWQTLFGTSIHANANSLSVPEPNSLVPVVLSYLLASKFLAGRANRTLKKC
ncbi:MAG: hypothetical protein AAGD11_14905 [Planctomycetota bacterium]